VKKKTTWIIAGAAAIVVLGGAGIAVAATDPFDQDNDALTGTSLERASDAAIAEVGEGTVTEAERSDDPDHAYTVEVRREDGSDVDVELDDDYEVVRVDGAATGGGTSGSDSEAPSSEPTGAATGDDAPVSADDRSSAEKAALDAAGPGTVTDLDRSDDTDHAWEVEVTAADGRDVDVELDAQFAVVRIDSDQQ
jgi:uncharacterized membrane protein YkoI